MNEVDVNVWANLCGDVTVEHIVTNDDDQVELVIGGLNLLLDEASLTACAVGFAAALAALRVRLSASHL